jgi:Amidohydrolase
VREALYSGFDDAVDRAFATFGIGWHYETGVQFLRLALAGVFDRFPDLQVLLGHWGEVVLFYLDRSDGLAAAANLPQSFTEYVRRNAYITAGGVYSERYLQWALEVVGVERIMFATDYPYRPGPDGGVEHFLQTAGLDRADQERIAAVHRDSRTGPGDAKESALTATKQQQSGREPPVHGKLSALPRRGTYPGSENPGHECRPTSPVTCQHPGVGSNSADASIRRAAVLGSETSRRPGLVCWPSMRRLRARRAQGRPPRR